MRAQRLAAAPRTEHTADPSPAARPAPTEVAIIGAGFAGVCMAIRLKGAGHHDFTIYEKADRPGGVWRDNTYPGLACDIQSHLYSFSFEPNPSWSAMFAPQREILAYLEHCIRKYDLAPHIRYGSTVSAARFDASQGRWRLGLADGTERSARYLVVGTGALNAPQLPDIPGRASFAGPSFHSAKWEHQVELAGKRVAVVGTGASAIQVIPAIAPKVAHLSVFQRTPPWVLPKLDRPIGPTEQAIYRRFPFSQKAFRYLIYGMLELGVLPLFLFPKLLGPVQALVKLHLWRQVRDPALRKRLTPTYSLGCKRILLANDYYPALQRANVEVITDDLERIVPEGIVSKGGTLHPVDAIVYCTGFRVGDGFLKFPITGIGGEDLAKKWDENIAAYYGAVVAGFPNLFFIMGPNTSGYNSIILMIEAHVNYIMSCMDLAKKRGADFVDVREGVLLRHNAWLQKKLEDTVWQSGCTSWFLDKHGDNKAIWPGFTFRYVSRTRRAKARDFHFVRAPKATVTP